MTDIFTEVDEGVRQEKLASWWARWRLFVYGAVAVLVGSVAINEFVVKPQAEADRAARAAELEAAVKALEDGQYEEAAAAFQAIIDSGSKLAPMAAHYLAQTRIEAFGETHQVKAGMSLAAHVVLERRAIWEWVFEPLLATRQRLSGPEAGAAR